MNSGEGSDSAGRQASHTLAEVEGAGSVSMADMIVREDGARVKKDGTAE